MNAAWVQQLGWTLLHFLWQGSAIALVWALLRALFRRSLSAQGRYLLACLALAAMAAAPVVTFLVLPAGTAAGHAIPPIVDWSLPAAVWHDLIRGFVALWITGVIVFSIRLAGGWRLVSQLRRTACPAEPEWQRKLEEIAARVKTSRPVRLFVSSLVDVPTVIGWLRPAILVPLGTLTGLPAEQVYALLAHELAHIRRYDYLAGLLQSLAETLLFYHPAVWWISSEIRNERELCCDDAAVAASGDVLTYARALAQLEAIQPQRLSPAMAANGGSLLLRIRRLIDPSQPGGASLPGPGTASAIALLWLASAGAIALHASQTPGLRHIVSAARALATVTAHVAPQLTQSAVEMARNTLLYDPLLRANTAPPPKKWQPDLAISAPPLVKKLIATPAADDLPSQVPAYARLVSPLKEMGALPLPQRSRAIIPSATQLVQVEVAVRDHRGPVPGLTQNDFQLFDNGEEQEIGAFTATAPKNAAPVQTVIFLDRYGADVREEMSARQAIADVLRNLPTDEPVAVCVLDNDFRVISEATDSPAKRTKALIDLWPVQNNSTIDHPMTQLKVLDVIAGQLGNLPGRKNLVWIARDFIRAGDTQDTQFNADVQRTLHSLNAANVAIFPVDMQHSVVAQNRFAASSAIPAVTDWQFGPDFQEWARQTSGDPASHMDLRNALQHIFEDSRTSYTLSFYPAALDGAYHDLKVNVARRGVDVLSRQGYLAGGTPRTETAAPNQRALRIGWITFGAATDARLDNSSSLLFSTEIYDRNLGGQQNSGVALVYRVLDRNTGIERYASGEAGLKEYIRPGSPVIPFATQIPSDLLKPGSYRLEVTVRDTSAPEYVVRTADFEIADEHHD
jgi:VWFA-related protein